MNIRVLIINENPRFLKVIKKTIEAYNDDFLVETVTEPDRANRAVLSTEYALIICDFSFINSGAKLVSSIMQSAPDVPIIISGCDETVDVERSPIFERIRGFIDKPVRASDLAAKVIFALGDRFYQGVVKGIRVAPFLQIAEQENTSCLLKIVNHEKALEGLVFYKDGAIINAVLGTVLPLDAVKEILFWRNADIFIYNICTLKKDKIGIPITTLILKNMEIPGEDSSSPDKKSVTAFTKAINKPVGGLAGLYLNLNKRKK
jgi:DNA-binding NarL/FixJ family response regulator